MTTAADFDTPWKSAPARYLPSCLELFLPEAHTDIDWDRGYEVLEKELQQVFPNTDAGRQLVDALVKVWRRDGTERWVLIHIEVQGRYDRQFPKRMFDYWVRIRAAFGHQVVSLAILTDISRRRWPGRYHESAWNTAAALRYEVVKLIDYQSRQAELEASANPFAVIVLAHLTSHQTRGRTAARGGEVRACTPAVRARTEP